MHLNHQINSVTVSQPGRVCRWPLTWLAICCPCRRCRDLDARAKNERYRTMFRLTQDERLDGHTDCTLWTPFAKMHVVGQLFISNNYICFNSREEDLCQLIIPLREVNKLLMNPGQFSNTQTFTPPTKVWVKAAVSSIRHWIHLLTLNPPSHQYWRLSVFVQVWLWCSASF